MIKVQCSKLEQVRSNPSAFAQSLKDGQNAGKGSYGMFACWQTKVKDVHQEKLKIHESIKALQQRFMTYADNAINKKKQEFLLDRLMPYFEEYQGRDFKLEKSLIRIKWELVPEVSLTGNSPCLVSNENLRAAYYFTEKPFDWQSELRFPLLQYYLAEHFFKCSLDQVLIGVYCLSENRFSLKSFKEGDVNAAIEEARELFSKIKIGYLE